MIEQLSPEYFARERWEAGSLANFGIETRYASIERNRALIRKYAIGYCPGERLTFRQKDDCVAVMFFNKENGNFWTHLTKAEFEICFSIHK
jgi:hypothetical protein